MMAAILLFSSGRGGAYAPIESQMPLFGGKAIEAARIETMRAALAGWVEEQFKLATFYDEGGSLALDYEVAAFWYGQAAMQDHIQASLRLGELYYFGHVGVVLSEGEPQPDYAQACALFEKAAANNVSEAMFYLGSCALLRQQKPDYAQAAYWYGQAAEKGETRVFLPLAQLYYQGEGVSQDLGAAFQWFKKAAEQGEGEAAFYLGFMLSQGEGVARDEHQARSWYTIAARRGEARAYYNLALLYEEGRGGARDWARALQLYQWAAAKGDIDALVKIGSFYEQGLGVSADRGEAFAYYQQAAQMGDEEMQYYLGLSYSGENDANLPARDYDKARFWLEKAALQGHSLAQARLDMLRRLGLGER